ncbi:MAG: tRNA-dihydrouridine synthase, partial [Actinomycetota bacterium]|nr:tRNA-dihydrouridine synthase [Actinomycetota bacterium]
MGLSSKPLAIGPLVVDPPVVLAPMAGVTNIAFRRLCRTYGRGAGAGLYVSEMVTARALLESNPRTLRMSSFGDDEPVRSLQLYGTDPVVMAAAV